MNWKSKIKHIITILRNESYYIVSENIINNMKWYAVSIVFTKNCGNYTEIKNGLRIITSPTKHEAIDLANEDCLNDPYFEGCELNQYTSVEIKRTK